MPGSSSRRRAAPRRRSRARRRAGAASVFNLAQCYRKRRRFEDAARSLPVKRHDDWEVREIWNDDGASQTLYVRDLDEALEDAERTGRGSHVFLDELECRIYGLCDGGLSAEEIASSILDELDEDESDEVTREDVYLRLARLWRRTLIRLML